MTTKYYPPSVDDTGPSFTSDEIYQSEVGKKFTEALEKQRIEKCFEEIKQVLKKHECDLIVDDYHIEMHNKEVKVSLRILRNE